MTLRELNEQVNSILNNIFNWFVDTPINSVDGLYVFLAVVALIFIFSWISD